eukprot:CAMPEP_0115094404 /NCGR_PEP_ID=MMETSP0227-20121206/28326_1 /TAXON_ID=89957 /ORGANISM="Polarella glacialis, Strain CCMP 1383" /LENGTH=50 /DNA_ID=CAMNT_0002487377 /DNA_START=232 /DNA_END=380 /DNA_ORIENTATION=-
MLGRGRWGHPAPPILREKVPARRSGRPEQSLVQLRSALAASVGAAAAVGA